MTITYNCWTVCSSVRETHPCTIILVGSLVHSEQSFWNSFYYRWHFTPSSKPYFVYIITVHTYIYFKSSTYSYSTYKITLPLTLTNKNKSIVSITFTHIKAVYAYNRVLGRKYKVTLANTLASFTPLRAQNEATSASLPGCSPKKWIFSYSRSQSTSYLLASKLKAKEEIDYSMLNRLNHILL